MSIFEDLIWYCNARAKGVDYANTIEKLKKCESKKSVTTVVISFYPGTGEIEKNDRGE